ncbi:MAG: hypothetical protein WD751_10105 [Anaerolineales bacterium]
MAFTSAFVAASPLLTAVVFAFLIAFVFSMFGQGGGSIYSSHEEAHSEDPRGHGLDPAAQNRHTRMAEAIRDCRFLLARGMDAGVYHSIEQAGISPIITDIDDVDKTALKTVQGTIVDHKEKLH